MKMKLDFVDLFQKSSRSVSAGHIVLFNTPWVFVFLVFFLVISVHTPYQMVAVMHRRCLKTANRNSRRKKNKLFCFVFPTSLYSTYVQTNKGIYLSTEITYLNCNAGWTGILICSFNRRRSSAFWSLFRTFLYFLRNLNVAKVNGCDAGE